MPILADTLKIVLSIVIGSDATDKRELKRLKFSKKFLMEYENKEDFSFSA